MAEATSLTRGIRARMRSRTVVERRDRRVCAVPFSLGSEPEDDDARDQAAESDDDRQHPRVERRR